MIPNQFHFIFGLKENFGGKPFSLVHYLAIKSALELNKPDIVYFYYKHEPEGKYWDKIKPYLTLEKIDPPQEIFGRPLMHIAHQAGVLRIQNLLNRGGIYLDCDTICVKPFTDLLQFQTVMGIQGKNAIEGLCDAVILSEKNSSFLNLWLNSYSTFRSVGRDHFWDEHAVRIPLQIAIQDPSLITITKFDRFHYPLYTDEGISMLFEQDLAFPNAFCHHLWEQNSWEKYLKNLSEEYIFSIDTTYNRIARRFLQGK
jgi:hypothetical protein